MAGYLGSNENHACSRLPEIITPYFLVILLKPLSMHRFTYMHVQSGQPDRIRQVAAQPFPRGRHVGNGTWGTCRVPVRGAPGGFSRRGPSGSGIYAAGSPLPGVRFVFRFLQGTSFR